MKVYNYGKVKIDAQINFSNVNKTAILDSENDIMIPYEDDAFLISIRSLVDDVVFRMRPEWKTPDYENSKCHFYITGDQINLLVEALPKRYSADEKLHMMHNSDKTIREDGYSDYYELLDLFDVIDNVLNRAAPMGEMYNYPIEMVDEERNLLFSICD